MFRLTTRGIPEAQGYLERATRGCASIGALRLKLQTTKPYAWGIETGYRRDGRLARSAGGAYMLRDSWRQIAPEVGRGLANAIPASESGVAVTEARFGARWLSLARSMTPVKTGALRASINLTNR